MVKLTSEIFEKSRCLYRETHVKQMIERELRECGYTSDGNITWHRGAKTVILKLVDEWSHNLPLSDNFPSMLPKDTIVITDNLVNSITLFKVLRLPDSFFGIYSYVPDDRTFAPDRRYSLLANRFDDNRVYVLLELLTKELQKELNEAYITFNCIKATSASRTLIERDQIFKELALSCSRLPLQTQAEYSEATDLLNKMLPYKNFDIGIDEIFTRSWLNLVLETYVSDCVLSLSEKTFRSLVTPAPSIIYGSRYTSVWLQNLGFDVVDDIIDYRFDSLRTYINDHTYLRYKHFVTSSIGTYRRIARMNFNDVSSRFKEAAEHNIEVLANYNKTWMSDISEWLVLLRKEISKN